MFQSSGTDLASAVETAMYDVFSEKTNIDCVMLIVVSDNPNGDPCTLVDEFRARGIYTIVVSVGSNSFERAACLATTGTSYVNVATPSALANIDL